MLTSRLMGRFRSFPLVALLLAGSAHGAKITVATIQTKGSTTGLALAAWAKTVASRTGGEVTVEVHFSGTDGDEGAVVEKMKAGALVDAALLGTVGLGKVWRPILALEAPGLFTTWAQVDAARAAIRPEIDTNFSAAGLVILGPVDFGWARVLSRGAEVRSPTDLQGRSPYIWADDMVAPVFYRTLGGVSTKPLSTPAVSPALSAATVDAVFSSCAVATERGWLAKLENGVGNFSTGAEIGALVVRQATLNALTPEQRRIVVDTGAAAAASVNAAARRKDAECVANLPRTLARVTTLTPAEIAQWNEVFARTRAALKDGVIDPALLTKLESFGR